MAAMLVMLGVGSVLLFIKAFLWLKCVAKDIKPVWESLFNSPDTFSTLNKPYPCPVAFSLAATRLSHAPPCQLSCENS